MRRRTPWKGPLTNPSPYAGQIDRVHYVLIELRSELPRGPAGQGLAASQAARAIRNEDLSAIAGGATVDMQMKFKACV